MKVTTMGDAVLVVPHCLMIKIKLEPSTQEVEYFNIKKVTKVLNYLKYIKIYLIINKKIPRKLLTKMEIFFYRIFKHIKI